MPQLLVRPFAESGDKTVPPDNDNSGFVSFVGGYTPDYEINLQSGNVNAKAVERQIQNGLFNLMTDNLLWYQTHGFMQWFSMKTDGYSINDMVVDVTGSGTSAVWKPYRCRKNGVTSRPPISGPSTTNADPDWEEVPLPSVARASIPFQLGVDPINKTIGSAAFLTSGTSLNTYTSKGFYISPYTGFSVPGAPAPAGGSIAGFTLEVAPWSSTVGATTTTFVIQRLCDFNGNIFLRTATNGAWSVWVQEAKASDVQGGVYNWGTATGTPAAMTLTPQLGVTNFRQGMEFKFIVPGTGMNATTPTFRVGTQAVSNMIGLDGLALPKNTIVAGQICVVRWSGAQWILVDCGGGERVVPKATSATAAVNLQQLNDVAAKILTYDQIYPVGIITTFGSSIDPNTAFAGTTWEKLPEGVVLRTAASGQAVMATGGSDTYALTMANIPAHNHAISLVSSANSNAGASMYTATVDLGTKTTSAVGDHNHTFSGTTTTNGDHSHGAYAEANGNHNHGGGTQAAGEHTHNFKTTGKDDRAGNFPANGENTFEYWGTTEPAGNHNHGIVFDGYHSHAIGVYNAGNHAHTYSGATSANGGHSHTVVLGQHNHAITIPTHTHTFNGASANTGATTVTKVDTLPAYIALFAWRRTK